MDPSPLCDLIPRIPNLRLVLLNAGYWGGSRTPNLHRLGLLQNVYFDIAMVEGAGGLGRLIRETSPSRVVFGSHYPFFYFESALLKVREAGLPAEHAGAVRDAKARALLDQLTYEH